ncbi:MAG: hypothetical protein ACUVXB_15685 [Bryobacteraceae bacterium]
MPPRRPSYWYAAWYACIAAGFVLLGLRALLLGAPWWAAALRWIIAGGFAFLVWLEWKALRR